MYIDFDIAPAWFLKENFYVWTAYFEGWELFGEFKNHSVFKLQHFEAGSV